jgi:uncharacterized Zn finger protein
MKIKCPHCNNEMEINDDIIKKFYNWQCEECGEFIQLKGNFLTIWKCNRPT